jgi:NAD(P)-dependent dehydrogenase (short-subunit alcohol dehydrogenase family)
MGGESGRASPGPVLLEFQAVMQQFLEIQRNVLAAYLASGSPDAREIASVPPPAAEPPGAGAMLASEAPAALDRPAPAPDETRVDPDPIAPAAPPPARAAVRPDESGALRLTLRTVDRPLVGGRAGLAHEHVVVITDDGRGIATGLAERLRREGRGVALVGPAGAGPEASADHVFHSSLDSLPEAERVVAAIVASCGPVAALVHLLPLAGPPDFERLDVAAWRDRLSLETRSLFLLAKALRASLGAAADRGGAALVAVTGMGGAFGSDRSPASRSIFPGHGGVVGLSKCLGVEWPGVRVRAVDVDPSELPALVTDQVLAELWADDPEPEIGYARGARVGLELVPAPATTDPAFVVPSDAVILATGGARGITADVCFELGERYQPTFVLVGQSPLPERPEPQDTADLTSPGDLKRAITERLRRDGAAVTIPAVERAYQQLLKQREMRENIGALTAAGARVHYVALDVCDAAAFAALIDEVYATYGRIDGLIHGAGIIEDKLVRDKAVESFDRVFDTKTTSAFVLARRLRPELLKFAVFFSSVAGRFGNRGQADYAAANEVVNKLAAVLDQRWPVRVCSINWAPWDKRGMVSPELKSQFEKRGVALLAPSAGRRSFWEELQQPRSDGAEIVVAGAQGSVPRGLAASAVEATPLLKHAQRHPVNGTTQYGRLLDPAVDLYLNDHRLDGRPVLPLAFASELMAEAVQATWPELTVTAVRNLQLFKGIVLEGSLVPVTITIRMPVGLQGDQATEAHVVLRTPSLVPDVRYRAIVELAPRLAEPGPFQPAAAPLAPLPVSLETAYRDWTFHGPSFQRITAIDGIGPEAILGRVYSPARAAGVSGVARAGWVIDPFVFDAALQLLLIWSRAQNGMTALPSRFRAFRRYGSLSDTPLTCHVRVQSTAGGHALVSDVHFVDPGGRVLGVLEGMEASCSAALNRLTSRADGPSDPS